MLGPTPTNAFLQKDSSLCPIYIRKYFHLQKTLYTKKLGMESAFKELGSQLTTELQA